MTKTGKVVWTVAGSLAAIVAVAGVVVWTHLPSIASALASRAMGRAVTIGALRLSPGRWTGIELRDATVANIPGGTRPAMVTLAGLDADIDLWPLLGGKLVLRDVRVTGGDILLEKVDGQRNWRTGPKPPPKPGGGRDGFPTLLGATLSGVVTYRTSSGKPLVTRLDGVQLQTDGPAAPIRLSGPASYQGAPVQLDFRLGSFDQLHDVSLPFPTDLSLTSGDTAVHFTGTMTEPLDVNGADGRLSLEAPTPGVLERVSGASLSPAPPLRLAGAFRHRDPVWAMQQADGALGDVAVEDGTLRFKEGSADTKTPDDVAIDLQTGPMDVDKLVASFSKGGRDKTTGSSGEASLAPDPAPDTLLDVTVRARAASYGPVRLDATKVSAEIAPGQITGKLAASGGPGEALEADARLRATADGTGGVLEATATGTGLQIGQLGELAGAKRLPVAGKLDLHAAARAEAATASALLGAARGTVVASMHGGQVSAQWIELASIDVMGLLTSKWTMTPLRCLLATVELRDGVAAIEPLRVRSADGTIVARGLVDLRRDTLNVVVASDAPTTGALALDIPVQISGKLHDPSIRLPGARAGRQALAERGDIVLHGDLREVARRNACVQ